MYIFLPAPICWCWSSLPIPACTSLSVQPFEISDTAFRWTLSWSKLGCCWERWQHMLLEHLRVSLGHHRHLHTCVRDHVSLALTHPYSVRAAGFWTYCQYQFIWGTGQMKMDVCAERVYTNNTCSRPSCINERNQMGVNTVGRWITGHMRGCLLSLIMGSAVINEVPWWLEEWLKQIDWFSYEQQVSDVSQPDHAVIRGPKFS